MIVTITYTDGEFEGCALAPKEILEQLDLIWCDQEGKKLKSPKVINCPINKIKSSPIYLGGDHTITYYTVKNFVKKNKNPAFIVFDAHPDVFQAFENPTHQDYLKFLIEEKILKPENILIVGIRAQHLDEIKYLKKKKIKYIETKDIFDIKKTTKEIVDFLKPFKSIYLSIDIDVLDPAFAPGVSYVEPSGLTTKELLYIIEQIKNLNIKSMDLVEVNPDKDINHITTKTAAKIIAEFLNK